MDNPLIPAVKYATFITEGDGVTTNWDFNFAGGYISRDHIKAFTEDKVTGNIVVRPVEFVGPNTVRISPAVASGLRLVIYRDTPKTSPIVNYTDGSVLSETNLDKSNKQAVFIAAELADRVVSDYDFSNSLIYAVETATAASNTATAASNTANAIDGKAQQALDNSVLAVATSNAASVTSTAAQAAVAAVNLTVAALAMRVDDGVLHAIDFVTPAQRAQVLAGTVVDLTPELQAAFNAAVGRTLVINRGVWGLSYGWGANGLGINVPSNITVVFESGSRLESVAHNNLIYQMLRVWDKENVTVYNANLDGRRDLNGSVTGEFGMGIDVRGSKRVQIISPKTVGMWGDGIYLGQGAVNGAPQDVYVLKHVSDNCRRQGVSIVSGVNVHFDTPEWRNTSGALPSAGLDIEPDSNADELRGIRITNPRTINNITGIQIQLANLIGAVNKIVDIVISGHEDFNSTVAFTVSSGSLGGSSTKLTGRITSRDAMWVGAKNAAFLMSEYDALGPDVLLDRPTVVDSNRDGLTSPLYGSPFVVLRIAPSVRTYPMGGLKVIEATVTFTSGTAPRLFSFTDAVTGINGVVDCHFIDPVSITGLSDKRGNFRGSGSVSDRYGVWDYALGGSSTLDYNYAATLVTPNAGVSLTLADTSSSIARSPDVVIRNGGGQTAIVATAAGGNFVGLAVGGRIQSPVGSQGSTVRLRPIGSNQWLIMERVGVWNNI